MPISPRIIYNAYSADIGDTTTTSRAAVFIELIDTATGDPVPGNGLTVTVQEFVNGYPGTIRQRVVYGSLAKLTEGVIAVINNQTGQVMTSYDYQILDYNALPPEEPPVNTTVCDATVNAIVIDSKESAPGAGDAQVTIQASTSQGPLTYSLDGVNYQSSPVFTHLAGGAYTAYVSDAAGCTGLRNFSVSTAHSLLISDPSISLGNGNISRWNAAFNPIVFTYQRRDFEVTGITADGNGKAIVSVNTDLTGVITKDQIYLKAGAYNGIFEVSNVSAGSLTITADYRASDLNTGFVNINRLRSYYQVATEITYFDKATSTFQTIKSVNRPDNSGLVKADISSFLQSLLKPNDESDYSLINYRDSNLSACYTIRYAESWNDAAEAGWSWVSVAAPYYIVYAAKQLGDSYGGNLAAYVPFPSISNPERRAQWLTDFTEPAYSNGYPFDIGFIYSEALAGLNIYCELTLLNINRQPLTGSLQTSYLLNEDSSFLLNQDGSKLVIADASSGISGLAAHIGLNRLLINQNFPSEAYYFTLSLKYNDTDGNARIISQTQTVRIDDAVDDQSVYLRWIGLSGSWNYYRFVYNQEVSLDVQNAVIVKNYVYDWAAQDSIEQVISKQAGQKMKVMAEDLSVADIKGLQSIKYSPKVQMLVNKNPVKWQTVVLNTATFAEYETRNGQAPFSVTFNLPSLNIQTQ